jgi:DNA-directed RNA polymerase specialized sigma24 family protein
MIMDTDTACHVTVVLDRPKPAHQLEAVEHFVPLSFETLVGRAHRLIARYHVNDPAVSAEDTVQGTLLNLWRAMIAGKIRPIDTEAELARLCRYKLHQEVWNERVREATRKRGGAGTGACHDARASSIRQVVADFDPVDPHAPPADEQAIAQEELERRLELLARHDPSLRAVAAQKVRGFTHREISDLLGLTLSAVEHKVREIKAILGHAQERKHEGGGTASREPIDE